MTDEQDPRPLDKRLGDKPIDPRLVAKMNDIGKAMDANINPGFFNGTSAKREWGFILMVFPLEDHGGRCNYIANANRDDVVVMLKEQIARFEGQAEIEGNA